MPSRSSAIVALLVLVAAAGAYAAARETPLFAVQAVEVRGASPDTARAVREVLAPVDGRNLLALDAGSLAARLARVPTVAHAELDRSFPHTLVVYVREERPAAVVRRGAEAWLVASTGRVLDRATRGVQPRLARIWVPKRTALALGERVADPGAAAAVAAVARLPHAFPDRVRDVAAADDELTFALASGIELRLGDAHDLDLKLAVASRILPSLVPDQSASEHYLDVSVVERPVTAGTLKSEVEVEG